MNRAKIAVGAVMAGLLVGLTACDWDFGGSSDQTTARYEWVNFSGSYRAESGGVLVSDYSTTPDSPDVPNSVNNENVGSTDGVSSLYSGRLNNRSIVPGSLRINLPGFNFVDQGNANLTGTGGTTGSIAYGTGAWSVDLGGAAAAPGTIRASYQYTVAEAGQGSGASGVRIIAFTVMQTGNDLSFTDNNGSVYNGKLGRIGTTGASGSEDPTADNSVFTGEVIAQYTVRGTSAAGKGVTITGTFQGTMQQGRFQSRHIYGSWLESGGKTGDVNGVAR